MTLTLAGVLLYVAVQLAIGFWVSRRTETEQDYLLAGRRLGYGIIVLTTFATWFGAESCIGASGAIYEEGLSASAADPFGYALCLLLMGLLFARALHARGLTTLVDLFRQRFSPRTELFAVVLMVPGSVLWAAAQVRAFGHVLAASSSLSVSVATTIAAVTVIVYTTAGGLLADAVTDVLQGVILIAGIAYVGYKVAETAGGIEPALAGVDAARLRLGGDGSWLHTLERWAIPVCGSLFAQELVARVLAARSATVARRSTIAASALYVAVGLVPVFIGLVGPRLLPALEHGEELLPRLGTMLLSPLGYVIFAGALVSAILSTADSALLVAGSLVSHNVIVQRVPNMTERGKVRAARAGVIVFGVVAYGLALASEGVHELVQQASGFGSAGLFVIALVSLWSRFGDDRSAIASLAAGVVVYSVCAYVLETELPYLSSLAAAIGAYAVVGLVTAKWPATRTKAATAASRPEP